MSLKALWQFADFCFAYLATQLGRSVLCSFFLLAFALVLRGTALKNASFLKGFLWAAFFLLPFVGRLKVFYENPFVVKAFIWWMNLCVGQKWASRAYMAGVAVSLFLVCRQHRAIKRLAGQAEPYGEPGSGVAVGGLVATPFSTGLLHPKVVMPRLALEHCSGRELELMVLHERNHIRLGHLWLYFFWDVLRSLLWPNPLLTVCTKYFREDLEEICDRVTIQKSGENPCGYGKLLLKMVRLLQKGRISSAMAFAGEGEYGQFKRRIQKIVSFQPYHKGRAACLCCACTAALAGMYFTLVSHSYPKNTEISTYILVGGAGDEVLVDDSQALERAISRDSQYVYIDRGEMDRLFAKIGIEEPEFYLGFGGYMKLPGMGGGGCSVYVDYAGSQGNLTIPYWNQEDIFVRILKIL